MRTRNAISRQGCLLVIATSTALSGCMSILCPTQQGLPTECLNVPNAGFSAPADGAGCRSGQALRLDRRKDHVIEIKADGYEPRTIRVVSEGSVLRAVFSVILNGLVATPTLWIATPFLVGIDIRSGSWSVLEPGELRVELHRPGEGPPDTATEGGRGASASSWPPSSPASSGFCSSCGARIGDTSFCTGCGARIR